MRFSPGLDFSFKPSQSIARDRRGMLSRPPLADILRWRAAVDAQVEEALPRLSPAAQELVALGIQHEHEEFLMPVGSEPFSPIAIETCESTNPRPSASVRSPSG